MRRKIVAALLGVVVAAGAAYAARASDTSGGGRCATYNLQIPPPGRFSKKIDNPYFPLPV